MSASDPSSARYSTEDFLSSRTLDCADAAVDELFETMLGLSARVIIPPDVDIQPDDFAATVRFGGAMRGTCEVRMSSPAAGFVASILLGTPIAQDDEYAADAVGELCNIIGGGWKNRVFAPSSRCSLSPPIIVIGYGTIPANAAAHLRRIYGFSGHTLSVTLTQEEAIAA